MDKPKVIHSVPVEGATERVYMPDGRTVNAPTYAGDRNYELHSHISENAPGGVDTLVAIERKVSPTTGTLGEAIPATKREIAQLGVLTAWPRGAEGASSSMRSSVLLLDGKGKMAGNPVVVGGRAPDEILRTVAQEVKAGQLTAEHGAAVLLGGARVAKAEAALTKTPALGETLLQGAGKLQGAAESFLHHANNPEGLLSMLKSIAGRIHG